MDFFGFFGFFFDFLEFYRIFWIFFRIFWIFFRFFGFFLFFSDFFYFFRIFFRIFQIFWGGVRGFFLSEQPLGRHRRTNNVHRRTTEWRKLCTVRWKKNSQTWFSCHHLIYAYWIRSIKYMTLISPFYSRPRVHGALAGRHWLPNSVHANCVNMECAPVHRPNRCAQRLDQYRTSAICSNVIISSNWTTSLYWLMSQFWVKKKWSSTRGSGSCQVLPAVGWVSRRRPNRCAIWVTSIWSS